MASRTGSPAPQPDLSTVLTALTGAIAQLAQSQTALQQNLAQVAHNQAALNTAMQGLVASTQAMQLALQNPPAQTFAPAAVKMTAHIVEKPEKFDGLSRLYPRHTTKHYY
jgi:ABC-type transporter Mla subunit MlaD